MSSVHGVLIRSRKRDHLCGIQCLRVGLADLDCEVPECNPVEAEGERRIVMMHAKVEARTGNATTRPRPDSGGDIRDTLTYEVAILS